MPLEPTQKLFYGPEAITIGKTVLALFADYLNSVLNNADGDYYSLLGLGEVVNGAAVEAVVVRSTAQANKLFKGDSRDRVVLLTLGPCSESTSGRKIDGVDYDGLRHTMTLMLDMGVCGVNGEAENPVDHSELNETLAGVVRDAIGKGVTELELRGLHDVEVKPDAENQLAGNGWMPHKITLLAFTLNNYSPA
ncbi:MAG TPA: hypothetical protein VF719_12285 [Abditibacteriaceae bacterium]|jgi:hypothetical protein